MPKFLVKSNILRGGKLYEPGAQIELSEKEAAEMPWAVEPMAAPASEAAAKAKAAEEAKAKAGAENPDKK